MRYILITVISFCLLSCASTERKKMIAENISAQAAQEMITNGDVLILDVRTKQEFEDGHIKGALNIDIRESDFMTQIEKLDRSKNYIIHCKSGGRSAVALEKIKDMGFSTMYHMNGGIIEWAQHNLPIEQK